MPYNDIASISPYFDDFDEAKAYYSLLFNPGRAVQGRELTQIQSVLQNQVKSFANHIFKDNSIVVNANLEHSFDKNYVNILDDASGYPASQLLETFFLNKTISDGTTVAKVTHIDQINFRLYFNYVSGPGFDDSTAIELVGPIADDTDTIKIIQDSIAFATVVTCDAGIVYTGGFFVVINTQEVIVDAGVTGHYHIGFTKVESAVSSALDASLADPASGTNNAAQPGADRYKIDLQLSSHLDANSPPTGFIEFLVVDNKKIIKATTEVQFADILDLLARRTYDESGDYVVNPFGLVLEDHDSDTTKLTANMQPGKAYISGFRIDKDLTSKIDVNRSRATRTNSSNGVFAEYGQYVIIAAVDGSTNNTFDMRTLGTGSMPDFAAGTIIDLMDGTNGAGSVLGTCRPINMKRVGDELRLYVTDISDFISILGGVKSLKVGTSPNQWYANLHRPKGYSEIFGSPTAPILEFDEYSVVQSLTDITYKYAKTYAGIVANGSNQLVISGSAFDSFGGSEDIISIIERAGSVGGLYQNLTVSGAGSSSITITGTPAFSIGATFDLVLSVTKTPLSIRTKTLITDFSDVLLDKITVNTSDDVEKEFLLSKEDGLVLKKIYQRNNFVNGDVNDPVYSGLDVIFNLETVIDVTQVFLDAGGIFDNGQREFYYDFIRVEGMTSDVMIALTSGAGNTEYYIVYDYFTHSSGSGKAFTADSYLGAFEKIPSYTISDGSRTYNLTNSVDFRFKISELPTSGAEYPYQGTQLIADVVYYLSRIDKIYLSKQGEFAVKEGVSSLFPEEPNDINDSITLYTMELPAYTYDRNDALIKQINHRRYTMRDIGDMDARLTAIEEYTALNLLEKSATDLVIQDVNGLDMFKSGIFVDGFSTYETHNINAKQYDFVIDKTNQYGRGPFTSDFIDLTNTGATANSNVSVHENTVTAKITGTKIMAENDKVTGFLNVNPLLFHQWNGTIKLTPSTDQWISTIQLPTIINSTTRTTTRLINIGWDGEWNFWNNRWFGFRRRTGQPVRGDNTVTAGGAQAVLNRSNLSSRDFIGIKKPPITTRS